MMEFELEGSEYIELNKLLKILNLAESGGEANFRITEGEIIVNKQVELQKRKKLRAGDIVECDGIEIKIIE